MFFLFPFISPFVRHLLFSIFVAVFVPFYYSNQMNSWQHLQSTATSSAVLMLFNFPPYIGDFILKYTIFLSFAFFFVRCFHNFSDKFFDVSLLLLYAGFRFVCFHYYIFFLFFFGFSFYFLSSIFVFIVIVRAFRYIRAMLFLCNLYEVS